jgi:beta-xylosidase
MRIAITILILSFAFSTNAQTISKVWVADNGDGTYKNPVINADYSDPDAIRVGNDFYMISSSFNHVPGLPILHSKDLVNWQLIGHALKKNIPEDHFDTVQHGGGVWAPSIRFHNNEYYIYYPDPDFGIYLIKAKNIEGPWSDPLMVQAGKGLIDPCPLWDDNGKCYLVHAYAGSRAGIKSIIVVNEMNGAGTKLIGDPVLVYDGHEKDPTIEGPKFYKRNHWYYIFAPAGGVGTGWQVVLRSRNVYGPYERKIVMEQGTSAINGPHQGAWVNTQTGEDWFLHFQDKEAYGRVVHLQPMRWIDDWPVIGIDKDGDKKGEPVLQYKKPNVGKSYSITTPAESDEFNSNVIGLQWQWQANPKEGWAYSTTTGSLRMYSVYSTDTTSNLWMAPNIIAQKLAAQEFSITTKITFHPRLNDEKFGLILFGSTYSYISVVKRNAGNFINYGECIAADKKTAEQSFDLLHYDVAEFYLRLSIARDGMSTWYYSTDGTTFIEAGHHLIAMPGRWVGAKVGFFYMRQKQTNDAGYTDIDWFRVEPIQSTK